MSRTEFAAVMALAFAVAGCAGAPEPEPLTPSAPAHDWSASSGVETGSGGGGEIVLRIEFEPPLRAPARLQVEHESGLRTTVVTTRTWASVRLPPGPVTLKLAERGERVLRLRSDEPTLTIDW